MSKHAHNFKDLTGRRFGRLTVLEYEPPDYGRRGARWRCVCDCGVRCTIAAYALLCGKTTSCGCYRQEVAARNSVYARQIWRVPVSVDGKPFPSMDAAAKAAGCSVTTVFRHIHSGTPFKDHIFKTL